MSKPPSPTHPLIHLETCPPCGQTTETRGAVSAAATIATIIDSHHMTPQPSAPPHEPPGMKTVTATVIFTLHTTATIPIHISSPGKTRHQVNLHQSRSLRQSAIQRGLPPRSLASEPHPPFTTTHHLPPFDLWGCSTTLKMQNSSADRSQDPHCQSFTPHSPSSAAVVPFDQFNRNEAPSGVFPHLANNSHAYLRALGDIFNGGCNQGSHISGGGRCNREE